MIPKYLWYYKKYQSGHLYSFNITLLTFIGLGLTVTLANGVYALFGFRIYKMEIMFGIGQIIKRIN